MPIPIVNSIASWFLKKRIHQMELFFKYPHEVQDELLMYLIEKGKGTEYGQTYGFESFTSYDDFARTVPVGNYKTKSELIERARSGEPSSEPG